LKGGSILASDAFKKSKKRRKKEADKKLQQATKAVTLTKNEARKYYTKERFKHVKMRKYHVFLFNNHKFLVPLLLVIRGL
jgi:hypothetical protein